MKTPVGAKLAKTMLTSQNNPKSAVLLIEGFSRKLAHRPQWGAYLYFHYFGFFAFSVLGDLFYKSVGEFLKFLFTTFQVIFGDQFFLFKIPHIIQRVAANIAHCNPRFLQAVMDMLDQLTAAFFIERRQVKMNNFPIVIGIQAEV